jgi:5'-nucleotidase (lipoprotein e(P4) family)
MSDMRAIYLFLPAVLLLFGVQSRAQESGDDPAAVNNLTYAVAWKQTAAEYRALYHQGFNIARLHVAAAIAGRSRSDKPLAVIADVDDTLLLSHAYWGFLLAAGQDFFDDSTWDQWVRSNRAAASPGALAFLRYCAENDVEVFYVTSRDQGDDTYALALDNLVSAGFPYADAGHLTVLRESSNKEVIQDEIRQTHEVVVMLGDNLNDFSRRYYVTDVDERLALMEQDSSRFGSQYVLFPNPTDGHWIRAIFGESEPPGSAENREVIKAAATRDSWPGL